MKILSQSFPKQLSRHLELERKYHNRTSAEFSRTNQTDLIWQIPEKFFFIDRYLNNHVNWVWLDLGCGPAFNIKRNLKPLLKKGDTYIGVDISEKLLAVAKKNVPDGNFIHLPMGELKLAKNSVDYLSFFGALHHEEYPQQSLKRLAVFLKPGGYIFLREPQLKAFRKGQGASPMESGFEPKLLRCWLVENRLQIKEWHFLDTIPWHFWRRVINKLRLAGLEKYPLFWLIKIRIELILEKIFIGKLAAWQGTDMFIVAQKKA